MKRNRCVMLIAAVAAIAILPIHAELSGSGTAADPYRISSTADWDAFAARVNAGQDSDAFFALASDLSNVTVPVGTQDHPFSGTFDGGSNTITVALSGSDRSIAPFSHIAGATIRNLKVAGTVLGAMHCSGLVGEVFGGP